MLHEISEDEVHSPQWAEKIEGLVRKAESIPDPASRAVTIDLLRAVLAFHAAAVERILELVFESGPAGEAVIEKIASDDLASSLLLLHNLHPEDMETRVNRAVRKLDEMFLSIGAKLLLVSMETDTVRVHFESQRPFSAAPVKNSIEKEILQAAPEITSVIVEGLREASRTDFVPVSELLAGLRV
jgi:hypothetical protein